MQPITPADIILPPDEDRALHLFTRNQAIALGLTCAVLGACFFLSARATLLWLNAAVAVFYVVVTLYKVVIIIASVRRGRLLEITDDEVRALRDDELPHYTILIPLFRESAVLPRLAQALSDLDYPKDKLQILLLLEETDRETIEACDALGLRAPFEPLVVPDSYPRTKPKACDVGLARATGEYLVVFDAEDRPEPDQLKKAAAGFRKSPDDIVCLQASLNFYNRDHNLMTRWFTTEYSMWFDLYLPGLEIFKAPIPLGGTSNHFKRETLLAVGGWDSFNVAEDCDLGIRLAKRGYRTRMLNSTTWEEACGDLGFWIRQRSRWVKGYMQTFAVHTRRPVDTIRSLGLGAFLHFLILTAGMFVSFLINPFYWLLTLAWIVFRPEQIGAYFPLPIFAMGVGCLFLGNFALVYGCMLGCCRRGYYGLVKYALLIFPYWMLISIAAWKAAWQLVTRPHYWEKTKHGIALGDS